MTCLSSRGILSSLFSYGKYNLLKQRTFYLSVSKNRFCKPLNASTDIKNLREIYQAADLHRHHREFPEVQSLISLVLRNSNSEVSENFPALKNILASVILETNCKTHFNGCLQFCSPAETNIFSFGFILRLRKDFHRKKFILQR